MPSIAVVGASTERRKFGNRCVRAFQALGYTVYPVHPREKEVEGLPAVASVGDIPADRLDLVSLYVSKDHALPLLEAVAAKDVGELWLNPGADHPEVVEKARSLGLNVKIGCSIMTYGSMPDPF
jgi:predicted CoA-binding protein